MNQVNPVYPVERVSDRIDRISRTLFLTELTEPQRTIAGFYLILFKALAAMRESR
jgi:hypothetical protein